MSDKKYTKEFVLKEVKTLLSLLEEDEDIKSINSLLLKRKQQLKGKKNSYAPRRWYDWKRSFFNDEEIMDVIDTIDMIVEERLVDGCLEGEYNAPFGKFAMVNRHGWREKSDINSHITGSLSLAELAEEAEEAEDPG
jgi:hypothetical protein